MKIFVILYNAGTENEGIHTLQIGEHNTILMFEEEDDATRFALMLEAQDFPPATVEAMDAEEIEAFCEESQYRCQVVPAGELLTPPEQNVEATDWTEEEARRLAEEPSDLGDQDLDDIRRRLENLL